MLVRKALLQDASNVYDLVNSLSSDGTLLKRAFAEICENIRDFTVAESDGGVFIGCGALHFYGPHLCEVRSIVVKPEAKGQGAGGRILRLKRPRSTAFNPCACLRAFPTSFSSTASAPSKTRPNYRIRSSKTARTAPACIVATKLRWCAVEFRACPSSDHGKRRRSWCGSRGRSQWSVISYRCPAFEVSQLQQMPGRSSGHRRRGLRGDAATL